MIFLIQTFDGKIKHDFSQSLIVSCDYQNWINRSKRCEYVLTDAETSKGYVPVGSVEFVIGYLQKYYSLTPKPQNIPNELLKDEFLLRNAFYGTEKDVNVNKFVKSNTKIKGFVAITDKNTILAEDKYLISDIIEIESEWRCFIYRDELIGLQNYSGDFSAFPDVKQIKKMVNSFTSAPPAYTLDVGINKDGTFIIEVHDFFSCGLYGFCDHRYLPFMFQRWFNWFINKKN